MKCVCTGIYDCCGGILIRQEGSEILLQSRESLFHYACELPLLAECYLAHAIRALVQFRIRSSHLVAYCKHHLVHEGLILPQQTPVTDAAAQDLAQHVAATL